MGMYRCVLRVSSGGPPCSSRQWSVPFGGGFCEMWRCVLCESAGGPPCSSPALVRSGGEFGDWKSLRSDWELKIAQRDRQAGRAMLMRFEDCSVDLTALVNVVHQQPIHGCFFEPDGA